jgi:hypothetical protein
MDECGTPNCDDPMCPYPHTPRGLKYTVGVDSVTGEFNTTAEYIEDVPASDADLARVDFVFARKLFMGFKFACKAHVTEPALSAVLGVPWQITTR